MCICGNHVTVVGKPAEGERASVDETETKDTARQEVSRRLSTELCDNITLR